MVQLEVVLGDGHLEVVQAQVDGAQQLAEHHAVLAHDMLQQEQLGNQHAAVGGFALLPLI